MVPLVEQITEGFENRGFIICMDRYYTTIDVIKNLSERGFGVYGAIMEMRAKGTPFFKKSLKKLAYGESLFYLYENQRILLSCWRDSKVVLVISNTGDDNLVNVSRNGNIDQDGIKTYRKMQVNCPENILTYFLNARGVDKFDQKISYYAVDHKSVKWYTRIILHLISVAMHNSFILYSKSKQRAYQKISYLQYQQMVIDSLASGLRTRKSLAKNSQTNIRMSTSIKSTSTDSRISFETPIQRKGSTSSTLTKSTSSITTNSIKRCRLGYHTKSVCAVCDPKKGKKYTNYWCSTHEIPLCTLNCYDDHRYTYEFI